MLWYICRFQVNNTKTFLLLLPLCLAKYPVCIFQFFYSNNQSQHFFKRRSFLISSIPTPKYSVNKLANLAKISQSYLCDIELGNKNSIVDLLSWSCGALEITLKNFFDESYSEKNLYGLKYIL